MQRLFTALESPYVSLIAHPTGRLIGSRDGYAVDIDKLIERAAETGTALEINANPNRLDLSAEWVRKAQEAGAVIAINTDAHSFPMLEHMTYGVGTARRGWLQKDTVINTWDKNELIHFFNRKR